MKRALILNRADRPCVCPATVRSAIQAEQFVGRQARTLVWVLDQSRASEPLFWMEPEAYRIHLAKFNGNDADPAVPAEEEVTG